jgi:phosphate transport system permease protein
MSNQRHPIDPIIARNRKTRPAATFSNVPPGLDQPRQIRSITSPQIVEILGSLFGAVVLGLTICRFAAWRGLMAPALVTFVLFLVIFSAVVRQSTGGEAAADRVVQVAIISVACLAVVPLVAMVGFVVVKGLATLRPGFFVQDMASVGPLDKGGGAAHAIVGSFEQAGLATLVAVPIAFMSAIYLNEMKGPLAIYVRFLVDAMSGVPSIVAGLFIFAFWVRGLGQGYSGLAGSLALIVLMLPTVTRTSEEVLRTIPDSLREASLALGAPQWRTVLGVVLPTARSGLLTASLLGIARAVGETAPMLMTARGASATNANPFSGQQSNLPLFTYSLLRQPNQAQQNRAFTGALVLLLLVGGLFTIARLAGSRGPKGR